MNFGRREVKYGGNAEGDEAEGLEMRERSPLKVVIYTNEKRRGSESGIEGREGSIIWTMN